MKVPVAHAVVKQLTDGWPKDTLHLNKELTDPLIVQNAFLMRGCGKLVKSHIPEEGLMSE